MKKNPILTLTTDIATNTAKTCLIFIITTALNQTLRETTKNTSEEFIKGYRLIKNKYF